MGMRQAEQLSADEAAHISPEGPTTWDEAEFQIRPDLGRDTADSPPPAEAE
jgi:hypothetical protein